MKKAIAIGLFFFLVVTFSVATAQKTEELKGQLNAAIMFGTIDEVKKLIKAGADVNHKVDSAGCKGVTPLFFACTMCFGNQAEKIKVLIDAGANVNEKFNGMTLLGYAAQFGGSIAVIEPLVANGLDVNAMNKAGQTPLYGAAFHGKIEWAEALIKNGADLNATEEYERGHTPLHVAILKKHKEVAELLIAKGADVNAKSKYGNTPLDIAISGAGLRKHDELVDLLRKHGGKSGRDK